MREVKTAFTLIEMLVVIGVIAVMAAGISMINFGGGSQSIYTAQQIMMGAFFEAKTVSLTRHTDTRVVIYKGDDAARKLRQVGVLYRASGDDDISLGWASVNDGAILPEGTFFIPPSGDFDKYVTMVGDAKESEVFKSTFNNGYTGAYSVVGVQEFPSVKPWNVSEGNGDFYCYQFSSDGMSMNPGARVMIGVGRIDGKGKYRMESAYSELGFVIHRIGNTIPFSSYDEISKAFSSEKGGKKDSEDGEEEKSDEKKDEKKEAAQGAGGEGGAGEQAQPAGAPQADGQASSEQSAQAQ